MRTDSSEEKPTNGRAEKIKDSVFTACHVTIKDRLADYQFFHDIYAEYTVFLLFFIPGSIFCFTPFDSMTINFFKVQYSPILLNSSTTTLIVVTSSFYDIFKQNPEFTQLCV